MENLKKNERWPIFFPGNVMVKVSWSLHARQPWKITVPFTRRYLGNRKSDEWKFSFLFEKHHPIQDVEDVQCFQTWFQQTISILFEFWDIKKFGNEENSTITEGLKIPQLEWYTIFFKIHLPLHRQVTKRKTCEERGGKNSIIHKTHFILVGFIRI